MYDFEGPPNVAVTIPNEAQPLPAMPEAEARAESAQDVNVRIHNKYGGFRFLFFAILIVAALTSGFCFFRALHVAQFRRGICNLPLDLRFYDENTIISGQFGIGSNRPIQGPQGSNPRALPESLVTAVKETINENLVEQPDGKLDLEYEIDIETETFEMTQMPKLSRGKYLHDFRVNKTLIIDPDNDRCFIMALNRSEIEPPRSFIDLINRLSNGRYQLDLAEIRHETRVVFPPLEFIDPMIYGDHIALRCQGKTSFLLEDIEKILTKRSAELEPEK